MRLTLDNQIESIAVRPEALSDDSQHKPEVERKEHTSCGSCKDGERNWRQLNLDEDETARSCSDQVDDDLVDAARPSSANDVESRYEDETLLKQTIDCNRKLRADELIDRQNDLSASSIDKNYGLRQNKVALKFGIDRILVMRDETNDKATASPGQFTKYV
jgi:hypothetical protein